MALPRTCILQDILSLDVTEDIPTTCLGTTSKSQPCRDNLSKEARYKARQILREPVQLNREVVKDRITALVELLVHKTKHRRNSEPRMRELGNVYIGKFDSYCEEQHLVVDHADSMEEIPDQEILPQAGEHVAISLTPTTQTEDLLISTPRNDPHRFEDRVAFGEYCNTSGALQNPSRCLDDHTHPSRCGCSASQMLDGQIQTAKLAMLVSFIHALFQPYASAIWFLFFSQHRTVDTETGNIRGEAGKLQVMFGVKGSIAGLSGVAGRFLLCLVTFHQLASILLGSWGFVMASLACLVWSHSIRIQLPAKKDL